MHPRHSKPFDSINAQLSIDHSFGVGSHAASRSRMKQHASGFANKGIDLIVAANLCARDDFALHHALEWLSRVKIARQFHTIAQCRPVIFCSKIIVHDLCLSQTDRTNAM